MPQIFVDFPEEDEEREILESQVPFAEPEVVRYVLSFLRAAHEREARFTVRDGINIIRYAMKILDREEAPGPEQAFRKALRLALDREDVEEYEVQ
jgi:hypothetical protein